MEESQISKRAYKRHDWPVLLAEFDSDFTSRKITSLKEFTKCKGLNYSETSREFSELKKERVRGYKERVESKLAEISIKSVDKLESLIDSEDENVAAKVSLGVLDRAGHSGPAALVNVTNSNQMAVVMPPMFSAPSSDLKNLLGADDDKA